MIISRRDALKTGLAGLGLLGAATVSSNESPRVLILGAGLAGLVAAFELEKRGFDIEILEARNRVGGRMYTLREPFSDGIYTEAGALHLLDTNPAIGYARQLGLEAVPVEFDRELHSVQYIDGTRLVFGPDSDDRWPYNLPEDDMSRTVSSLRWKYVWRYIHQIEGFDQVLSPGLPLAVARKLDKMTVREFLVSKGVSETVQELVNVGYLASYNGGIDHVSVLTLTRERASFGNISGAFAIKGGNDRLCTAMADSLRAPVQLEHPVAGIEQTDRGVAFHVNRGGVHSRHEADFAIVTAPLPVLAGSDLKQAFHGRRRRAIEEMPTVPATRTFIEVRRPFWLDTKLGGATTDTQLGQILLHHDTERQGNRGILESFSVGQHANALARLSARQRHELVCDLSDALLPGLKEHAEVAASVCWGDDPWSRGSFASTRPGQLFAYHDALNQPEGRIYLAGDSIGDCPGYSHSAVRSGIEVALKIAERSTA